MDVKRKWKEKYKKIRKIKRRNIYNVMWMRKGVVGKRNKKIRKIKKKLNTMWRGMEEKVSSGKVIKKIRKIKKKLNTMWLEERKDVAEKQIKKYRKIKKK